MRNKLWRFSILFLFTMIACLLGCIELDPPPPAPEVPIATSADFLRIGIETKLTTLQPILDQYLGGLEQGNQPTLFVIGSSID